MRPTADYTTLTQIQRAILKGSAAVTVDDAFLKQCITQASAMITAHCNRVFVPYASSFTFDALGSHIGPFHLDMSEDLLDISTLANGDGATISGSAFVLRPSNVYPKWRVQLKQSSGITFTYSGDWEDAITLAGIFGFHEDYPRAFGDTLEDVPGGGLTSSATSFTAVDADGLDDAGRQRFEVGQYLKIDSEVVKVVGLNTTTNVVDIRRAQLGTTAAAHSAGVSIFSYRQTPDIEKQCERLTVWLYQHRDSSGGTVQLLDGSVVLRDDTLKDIFAKLERYQRKAIRVV